MSVEMEKKVTSRSLPTLFIRSLPLAINEAGLRNLFRDFGDIREVYIHRTSGTDTVSTSNWAKVSFSKKQEAIEAIREVNGKPPLHLQVKFDRDGDVKEGPSGVIEMERNFGEESSKMMAKVWKSDVEEYEWPTPDQLVEKVDEPKSIDEDYKVNDEHSPSQDPTLSTDSVKKELMNRSLPTLFISKLSPSINEAGLRNLFREFGDIRKVYIHRACGPEKNSTTNWAKVSFSKKQEAIEAISKVNGKPPLHLHVKIDSDEDVKEGPRGLIEIQRNFGEKLSMLVKGCEDYEWPTTEQLVEKVEETKSIDTAKIKKENEIDEDYKVNDEASPSQDPTSSTDSETTDTSVRSFTFGNPLLVPYKAPLPCVQCFKSGRIICSRCHVWYCSQACQVINWPTHKDHCCQV